MHKITAYRIQLFACFKSYKGIQLYNLFQNYHGHYYIHGKWGKFNFGL